jgi:CRISPR type III-A-associated RAMP protein Csm4
MMAVWLVSLRPRSSLAGWLSSDTLFGALFWALRQLEGASKVQSWLQCCQQEPPQIAMSSAFPFVDADNPIRFLPKPLTLNPTAQIVAKWQSDRKEFLNAMELAKELSKANFLSETLFSQAAKGELTAEKLLEQVMSKQVEKHSGCLMTSEEAEKIASTIEQALEKLRKGKAKKKEAKKEDAKEESTEKEDKGERKRRLRLWATMDTQHTAVDRVLTSAAEGLLYFDTEHFFAPSVGLYFLLRCPDDFPIEAVLRFLNHSGVGGNKVVGKGHFEWSAERAEQWLEQIEVKNGDAVILLSRCMPKSNEFDWQKSVYRMTSRRPKFESAYGQPMRVHKGIVRQLVEGSVLCPNQFKDAYGQLVKVGDSQDWDGTPHPVFHNGIGFPLRMVMPDEVA